MQDLKTPSSPTKSLRAGEAEELETVARQPTPITTVRSEDGPRLPKRQVWRDLPEDYAGFRAQFWANHPPEVFDGVDTNTIEGWRGVFEKVITAHNNWRDENGEPYPPATDPTFIRRIPTELVEVLIVIYGEARSALPNLLRERKGS